MKNIQNLDLINTLNNTESVVREIKLLEKSIRDAKRYLNKTGNDDGTLAGIILDTELVIDGLAESIGWNMKVKHI